MEQRLTGKLYNEYVVAQPQLIGFQPPPMIYKQKTVKKMLFVPRKIEIYVIKLKAKENVVTGHRKKQNKTIITI